MSNLAKISLSNTLKSIGIPAIPVKLFNSDREVLMIVDTGADISIMDMSVYENYKEFMTEVKGMSSVVTAGSSVNEGFKAKFDLFCGDLRYREMFVCMDCSCGFSRIKEETGVQLHGILGTDFMRRHQWIIDFEREIIVMKST